jgi:membrane protease YdiL (CAAX protease family)
VALVTDPPSTAPRDAPRRAGVFAEALSRGEGIRWVVFAFAGFLGGQLVSAALVAFVAALEGQSSQLAQLARSSAPPTWYIVASLVGLWTGFLGAAALALRYGGMQRRSLGLSARPSDLLGLVIGVASQILIGLIYLPFRSHLKHFNAPITKLTGSSHGGAYALVIVLSVVGAPIVEEIFFRGLLLRGLVALSANVTRARARLVGLVVAVVVDGLLFALAHGELLQLPGLALFGMILAVTFYRSGRLGMCIVAHISFNALALLSYSSSGTLLPWH